MSDRRLASFLLSLALLVRVVAVLGTGIFGTDSGQFLSMAELMGRGRWAEACAFTYHPGYPFLVAAGAPCFGGVERAGFWVSVLLGSGALVPLFFSVRNAFGRAPAFFAGLVYAFHPYLIEVQADVMTEGSFLFFLCSTGWLVQRVVREPGWIPALLSGLSASAAYLVRPEGLAALALALAWPLAGLLKFRDRKVVRVGGLLLAATAALLLAFPFLSWVRSVKGRWAVSAKGSVERGMEGSAAAGATREGAGTRYAKLGGLFLRVTGLTLPFTLAGLWALRRRAGWDALVWLSFPAAHLTGLLYAYQNHPWLSHRYLLPPVAMAAALTGLGLSLAVGALERRRPGWPAPALVLLLVVLPGFRSLKPERADLGALRDAGAWIRTRTGGERQGIYSTHDQVGYFSGGRTPWMPERLEEARSALQDGRIRWFVYTEKDLGRKPPYIDALRADPVLGPPREFPGRPGDLKVYVHEVR